MTKQEEKGELGSVGSSNCPGEANNETGGKG